MHEVELLRVPLVFGWSHATFTLSEGGAVATRGVHDGTFRAAASMAVMRSGRHSAQFTVVRGITVLFGVVRPGCNVEGGASAYNVDGHYFYCTHSTGAVNPATAAGRGMQPAKEQGDRIGMLLDLDQGSMTVWKNDEKLGVMLAEGLSGEFCWAVEVSSQGESSRIESAPAPASPTEEELAAAVAYHPSESESDDE